MNDNDDGVAITLLIETAEGVVHRRIGVATRLDPDEEHGIAAEQAVQSAAERWGMPDFVFTPPQIAKGASSREVSDRLIAVDDIALMVQVKNRAKPYRDATREASWARKQATKAIKQINGSFRTIQSLGEGIQFENQRGRVLAVPADATWLGVVILGHDVPPEETIDVSSSHLRTVVLTRRDWEFLFAQLRSTAAVCAYIERIASLPPVPLGTEVVRYFQCAQEDAALD